MSVPAPVRGFILQPTYRLVQGRPVVHLYGTLDGGEPFLVRDRRAVPHFYVRCRDAARAGKLGAEPLAPTSRRTFAGEPVVRVEVARPADTPPLRQRLQDAGVTCFEADVRFAMRYLIDRGIRSALEIKGEGRSQPGLGMVFDDPEVRPASGWTPELSVLSLDIETDPRASTVLSIALYGCGAAEVLLHVPEAADAIPHAVFLGSEKDLLRAFVERVQALDPDVVSGWNVAGFDLAVLDRRGARLGVPMTLGRGPDRLRIARGRTVRGGATANIPGRVVLDGIDLLRGAFIRMPSYGLEAVAQEVLGEGKTLTGRGRAEEILRLYHEDRPALVEYNLTDARLVLEILERLELIELAVQRSLLTGMPPDRVAASIASFDFLYLSALGELGVVAPTAGAADVTVEPTGGGAVLTPLPGLYDNVLVLDFKSLYPSLIRTFNLDPLGYLPPARESDRGAGAVREGTSESAEAGTGDPALEDADPIVAPSGAAFSRRPGILPRLLDELAPRREAAAGAGRKVESHAIKILMNSFYGVLGTPACRFYNPRIANAITSFGRELLGWSRQRIEETYGKRVLYGDTDSLFVEAGESDPAAARRTGERLAAELTRDLAAHVATRWRVDSELELELERLYLRLLLPEARGGGGASKRYAGLVEEDGEHRVAFTGMEVVRRDWTELAKRVQREVYRRLFFDLPIAEYLAEVVAELRAGHLDELLTYRKALRKDLAAYTATTPPHVAAARKMQGKPGRVIAYVVTTAGPEPAAERASPLDYEHYVEKQVRAVAEPVLALAGIDFAKAIGDDRQLSLFRF